MARRSSGKGTTPLSTAIDSQLHQQLKLLAAKSAVSVNKYARMVLEDAVKNGVLAVTETTIKLLPTSYSTPEVISLRAAEKPDTPKPRRSAGG